MNLTKKVTLFYNPNQKRWYMKAKKKNGAKAVWRMYWGAKRSPIDVYLPTRSLKSPFNIPLMALVNRNNGLLSLGPLIGILTAHSDNKPFHGNARNFIDIMQIGFKKGAIIFVFTPKSIDWQIETIKGWIYDFKSKRWRTGTFPFPNVVYNRVPTRKLEAKTEIRSCIEQLSTTKGIELFNPQFFNKEDLYDFLQNSSTLNAYLPETIPFKDPGELRKMLLTHRELYLKPTKGKAGVGILKICYHPQHQTYYLYSTRKGSPTMVRSFQRTWKWILRNQIKSPYVIQRAVQLQTINKRAFEFRVLVQKNKVGVWDVAGIGVRVAGPNRITTHVPQGGRIEDLDHVLSSIYAATDAQRIKHEVRGLALSIAIELEKHYSSLAEISLDIGLDQHGKLWFFEANSKPMVFDEPQIRYRSLSNLVEYSQYVTFQQGKE